MKLTGNLGLIGSYFLTIRNSPCTGIDGTNGVLSFLEERGGCPEIEDSKWQKEKKKQAKNRCQMYGNFSK